MKSRMIFYIVLGGLVVCALLLMTFLLYNVVVFKIPILGPEMPSPYPNPLNTYGLVPVNHTEIPPDASLRNELITEDQAWEYAWAGLQEHGEYKNIVPLSEKTTMGLNEVIDNNGNKYLSWKFFLHQNKFPILQKQLQMGIVYVDARDGHILWYDPISW
jgi:hypothetical protein